MASVAATRPGVGLQWFRRRRVLLEPSRDHLPHGHGGRRMSICVRHSWEASTTRSDLLRISDVFHTHFSHVSGSFPTRFSPASSFQLVSCATLVQQAVYMPSWPSCIRRPPPTGDRVPAGQLVIGTHARGACPLAYSRNIWVWGWTDKVDNTTIPQYHNCCFFFESGAGVSPAQLPGVPYTKVAARSSLYWECFCQGANCVENAHGFFMP